MNLVHLLGKNAEAMPSSVAIADRNRRVTFGELNEMIAVGACELKRAGLNHGDTILFFHPVAIPLYTGLLSVMRAGMTAVFIDPSAPADFIERCCDLVQPRGFFSSAKAHLLRLKIPALRKIPIRFHTSRIFPVPGARCWNPDIDSEKMPIAKVPGDFPALITFTSGSTGEPKGVARSHDFLIAQHASLSQSLNLSPNDIDLVTLPIFTLANLASGTTSILADTDLARPGRIRKRDVARQIIDEKITRIVASPAFYESLLENENDSVFPEVREVYTGGAPVFPRVLDRLAMAFPNAEKIAAVYGSTEAEPIAEVDAQHEISEKDLQMMREGAGLLAGKPVPDIRLVIDEGGEILVTGDHVLKGYLNGRGDSETKVHRDGEIWHRTGDLGSLDEKGRLWLLGRKSAVGLADSDLKPFAVECAASFFSQTGRTAVIFSSRGIPLFVAEGAAGDQGDLKKLAASFGIEKAHFIDEIPMDRRHNAKVDLPELRKILGNR